MEKLTAITTINRSSASPTWEEESGLIDFLSKVFAEVARFDGTFGFDVSALPSPPVDIDGSTDALRNIGFVVVRYNRMVGRDYCLYSLLKGRVLYAYVGVYSENAIKTLKELHPLTEFRNGTAALLAWLGDLVTVSCEKI